jgi:hypothetical protein
MLAAWFSAISFVASSARAETFDCLFGDSIGVGLRDAKWEQGTKSGSLGIVYRREGDKNFATRQADSDPKIEVPVIDQGLGLQFIATWGPAPGSVVEVTTIASAGAKRAAVRSVQTMVSVHAPTVMIDFGFCEVKP